MTTLTGTKLHTVTNTWEPTRNVIASKENELPGGTLSKFTYTVNDIGQRVGLAPTGSAFATTTPFVWGYNARGELTSATRNGLTLFERSYSYDGIGNRLTATDHNAATTNYFADTSSTNAGGNALNQYEKIEFPGSATINPVHDADGNMTSGPVAGANGLNPGVAVPANASLSWDAENRMISATIGSTTTNYLYDAQSRLIAKSDDAANPTFTVYLYDGWNRIAEYEKNGSGHDLKRTYLLGMDLSGSMQGAGGVGGLLAMTVHDTTIATFFPTYDGNGNISEYINESGAIAAHFEYDPFGNLTVDSENNAAEFPYRFSTKPQDSTKGLYYYGYRYYDPVTGRWLNRDPIGERGGINLFGFVGNDAVNNFDMFGLMGAGFEDCFNTGKWSSKVRALSLMEILAYNWIKFSTKRKIYECWCRKCCRGGWGTASSGGVTGHFYKSKLQFSDVIVTPEAAQEDLETAVDLMQKGDKDRGRLGEAIDKTGRDMFMNDTGKKLVPPVPDKKKALDKKCAEACTKEK